MADTSDDARFTTPLYTVSQAARYLRVPPSTLGTWVDGYERTPRGVPVHGAPLITAQPAEHRGWPRLPFIGFAEAYVLSAFRKEGVPLQRIRASLAALTTELGPHALASADLRTDGAEVLWNTAQHEGEEQGVIQLLVPSSGQYVFTDVVKAYLHDITFTDRFAASIHPHRYGELAVVMDPRRASGQPVFERAGVSVADVLARVRAGEDVEVTARDYNLPAGDVRTAALVA